MIGPSELSFFSTNIPRRILSLFNRLAACTLPSIYFLMCTCPLNASFRAHRQPQSFGDVPSRVTWDRDLEKDGRRESALACARTGK